jgi:hypothetical protein
MARYSSFLGAAVEVQYRAGDILLPASGTFVGDTGRSIFLEQNFEQRGQRRQFRWEIPYQFIVRLAKKGSTTAAAEAGAVRAGESPAPAPIVAQTPEPVVTPVLEQVAKDAAEIGSDEKPKRAVTAAAGLGANVTLAFPRPQTAK